MHDPWYRRVAESAYVIAVCVSDLIWSAVEDAAARGLWRWNEARSERELRRGKFREFSTADDAIAWLHD